MAESFFPHGRFIAAAVGVVVGSIFFASELAPQVRNKGYDDQQQDDIEHDAEDVGHKAHIPPAEQAAQHTA